MKHRSAAERKEFQLTFVSCPCYYIDQKAGRGAEPHSVSPCLCQCSCHSAPAAACCHPWSGKWCTCHWRHFYSAVCDTGRGSSLCEQSRKNCPAAKQEEALHLGKLIWARVLGEKHRKHSPAVPPQLLAFPTTWELAQGYGPQGLQEMELNSISRSITQGQFPNLEERSPHIPKERGKDFSFVKVLCSFYSL